MPTGGKQKTWINDNISKIKDPDNRIFLVEIQKDEKTDLGSYLYYSGRCAIAHASIQDNGPIADANNYDDIQRIKGDISLIKELAEIFIKNELSL